MAPFHSLKKKSFIKFLIKISFTSRTKVRGKSQVYLLDTPNCVSYYLLKKIPFRHSRSGGKAL